MDFTPPGDSVALGLTGPVDERGRLLHEDDVVAQLALAASNVESELRRRGLGPTDLTEVRVHTTDVITAYDALDVLTGHLCEVGATADVLLVPVDRLPLPGMSVALEARATRPSTSPSRDRSPITHPERNTP